MRWALLLSGVLAPFLATTGFGGGVNLSWNDCGTAGLPHLTFECETNEGPPFVLYGSVEPIVTFPDFVAMGWVLQIRTGEASLPAWWSLRGTGDPPGRCRDASLTLYTSFWAGPFTCADPWAAGIVSQGFQYEIGYDGPHTARIFGSVAKSLAGSVTLVTGTEYYGFALVINRRQTVGVDACEGCRSPVCIVLIHVELISVDGRLIVSNPLDRNYVTWGAGHSGAPSCFVPTLSRTWGQLKSLYR